MLQQLYNTVDSIVVGNFLGSEALAAVGSSSSLIMLLISFSMGAAAGAGVIVSQFIGAQNKKGIHESVHTALAIALILGVVLTAAGLILSPQILRWMGTPEEVMPQSITYLRLYFAGVIFSILYNMASGFERCRQFQACIIISGNCFFYQYYTGSVIYPRLKDGHCRRCDCDRYQSAALCRTLYALSDACK